MSHELTPTIDTAQVVLYTFWIFFFGLIVWLRREDRREGYPLETDTPLRVNLRSDVRIPAPKQFMLPHGEGARDAPNFERDERPINAVRISEAAGYPLEPVGDPLLAAVGPASYAQRSDHPELMHEDGGPAIIPMRVAGGFSVSGGPDPRGWQVIGADGEIAGKVSDIWVDRADLLVRYLEIELSTERPAQLPAAESKGASSEAEGSEAEGSEAEGSEAEADSSSDAPAATETHARLVPIQMLSLHERTASIRIRALRADQFSAVPTTKKPDQITLFEEERIAAFYAGGWFYAEPGRREPLV